QAALRRHGRLAGVLEEEAAGAVGVLRLPGVPARLPEERRLLVARDAGNRQRRAEDRRRGLGDDAAAVDDARQDGGGYAEFAEHPFVPVAIAQVEQHRARGVGGVDDVARAAGEVPDEPAVDGTEGELAGLGAALQASASVVEQPAQLRAGEVGVDDEARARAHLVREAAGPQLVAEGRGAPALPDDGIADRAAGGALPQERRLALVGDADRRNVAGGRAGGLERALRGIELRRPDRLRVVRDPAGPRVDLRELDRRLRHRPRGAVEEDGARARGALI